MQGVNYPVKSYHKIGKPKEYRVNRNFSEGKAVLSYTS